MPSRSAWFALLGLAAALAARPAAQAQDAGALKEPPPGFTPLFNGKDLTGWHGMTTYDPRKLAGLSEADRAAQLDKWNAEVKAHWTAENGELVNDGFGAYASTDKEYGDIELLIDYKTVPKTDSGIYLRGTPQVQIWDWTEAGGKVKQGADKGSGGLWNNKKGSPGKDPSVLADKPFGEWNHFRIIQVGARTTVYLNDKKVVDHAVMENYFAPKDPLYPKGVIQLQTHGGEIRWRNLFVREIPADEADKILASHDAEGFQTVFDGKSLRGWAGPVDNYELVDGTLRCKAGKGGTVYWDKELKDFAARVEFKVPEGGNNGLAIRYPGHGDTAYVGMCELQVLDNDSPKYAKLDPRQFHGSVYGMAPAKKGYLRPAGDWNFQEVTVKGHNIKVELNGTPILDADVDKVTDFMAGSPHPGKDRTSGYFGFAGHNDPVQFRNVSIKPLD